MAMITYPLNDVQYSAEDAGLFHCTRTSGIWAEDSFQISATGADNSISIGTGVGWISNEKFWGKVFALKEAETLDLGIADAVYPRIDVVAVQFDAVANETRLIVKNGVPSSTPLMPDIIQTEAVYELYLCEVLRPAGSTVVSLSNITDTRLDPVLCGLMADSVTRIDTDSINSQVAALLEEFRNELEIVKNQSDVMFASEWAADGAITIENGGTGATTAAEAFQNITGFAEDSTYTGCYYRMVNGIREWFNPPMVIGTEYRTTRRYKGSPVYVMAVSLGTMPSSSGSQKNFTVGQSGDTVYPVDYSIIIKNSDGEAYKLPMITKAGAINTATGRLGGARTFNVFVQTNMSAYSGEAYVEYIKL